MWPLEEDCGLYQSPISSNGVVWSQDNLLAVPCGPAALILDPRNTRDLQFSAVDKMVTSSARGDFSHLDVQGLPVDAKHNLQYMTICNRQISYSSRHGGNAAIRHLSWSPIEASMTGGCILCSVSDDDRVRLYARPEQSAKEWSCFSDLTESLSSYVQSTNWAVVRKIIEDLGLMPEVTKSQQPASAAPASCFPEEPAPTFKAPEMEKGQNMPASGTRKRKRPEEADSIIATEPVTQASVALSGEPAAEADRHARKDQTPLRQNRAEKSGQPKIADAGLQEQKAAKQHTPKKGRAEKALHLKKGEAGKPLQSEETDAQQAEEPGGMEQLHLGQGIAEEGDDKQQADKQLLSQTAKDVTASNHCSLPKLLALEVSGYHQKDLVEVMTNAKHMEGAWFPGEVEQIADNCVLVAYASANGTSSTTREWFAFSANTRVPPDMPSGILHKEGSFQMRPLPPAQEPVNWKLGDIADVLQDHAWRPGEVTRLGNTRRKYQVRLHASGQKAMAAPEELRRTIMWENGKFHHLQDGKEVEVQEQAKAADLDLAGTEESLSIPQIGLQKGITLTKKSTKMQKENNGENQRKTLNGENTATEIGEAQIAMPVTRSGVDAVDTREGTGAGKLANPGDGLAAASEVKPRVKSPTGKTGFVFRKVQLAKPRGKGMRRPDAPIPGPSRKEESLPASPAVEAISGLPKAKGKGSTGRVTEKEVPQERPAGSIKKKPAKKAQNKLEQKEATKDSAETKVKTKKKQKIVPDNNNNVGAESQGVDDITVGKDAPGKANALRSTKKKGRQQADSADTDSEEEADIFDVAESENEETDNEAPANMEKKRSHKKKTSGTKISIYHPPDPYQVPADFDPNILLPVDTSSRPAFNRTFTEAFMERWLVLRCKIDPKTLPSYSKGSHMFGPDLMIYEQAQAEFRHVLEDTYEKFGITQKWINMECKRVIRVNVVNPTFRLDDESKENMIDEGHGEGPRKMTESELALRLVRLKREQRKVVPKPSSAASKENSKSARPNVSLTETPMPKTLQLHAAGQLSKQEPKKSIKPDDHKTPGNRISAIEYDMRVDSIAATCTAWSPVVNRAERGPNRGCTFLAVGSKARMIWLLIYSLPTPSCCPTANAEAASLQLVGSISVTFSWITSMVWVPYELAGSLLLCSGYSNGAVMISTLGQAFMQNAVSSPEPIGDIQKVQTVKILEADSRSVTSLDVVATGSDCISLAIGKADGSLISWTANQPDISALSKAGASLKQQGEIVSKQQAHATFALTSAAWSYIPQEVSPASNIVTSGLNAELKAWRLEGDKLQLEQSVKLRGDDGHLGFKATGRLFGVALSSNKLVAAVIRETMPPMQEALSDAMIHRKLNRAYLSFYPVTQIHPTLDLTDLVLSAMHRCLQTDDTDLAGLWDVAALLSKVMSPERLTAENGEDVPAASQSSLTREILDMLEGPIQQVMSLNPVKRKKMEEGLFRLLGDRKAAQRLQAANVFRRLLDPHILNIQAVETYLPLKPPAKSSFSRQWDALLRQNEFALLQMHVYNILKKSGELDNHLQLSSLLMADWAVLFASQMDTELKDLALGYHKSIGKQILDSSSPPPRESRYEIEAGFDRECHPVSSASQALLQIQGAKIHLQRCSASMQILDEGACWHCAACQRIYCAETLSQGWLEKLRCIFCGIRLSVPSNPLL